MVYPHGDKVTFSGFCIRFRPSNKQLESRYLLSYFKNNSIRRTLKGHGPNIQNISQPALARLGVPLPPLALQQEFAAFAAEVDKSRFDLERKAASLSDTSLQ